MNIQEATKLAIETGRTIYRKRDFEKHGLKIEFIPSNTMGYIVIEPKTRELTPMWNPMAEDILANDWKVVGLKN